jgi:ElaA protein
MTTWLLKHFDELTARELYAIMQLRIEVFVVEQQCIFQDADNKDQGGYHLMAWNDELLVAYSRIIPSGIAYKDYPSIGRVTTSPMSRKNGLGRELMLRSIAQLEQLFGKRAIKLGAQLYLKDFYGSLGFVQSSEIYLEDNIQHIEMIKTV